MDILTILRLALGTILIFIGLLIIVLAIIGIFRLNNFKTCMYSCILLDFKPYMQPFNCKDRKSNKCKY